MQTNCLTIRLPHNLASFRSVRSDTPPFGRLLAYLRRESDSPLAFGSVFLDRTAFAALRHHTRIWLLVRNNGDASQLDAMSSPGITAPLLSGRVAPGFALVQGVAR